MGRGPAQGDLRNVIRPATGRSLRQTGRDAGVGARLAMAALVVALQVLAVAAPLRVDAKEAAISGTITLTPELRDKLPKEPLLIVLASKSADPKKAPIIVKRIPGASFPYEYTLTEEDITLVGSRFEGPLHITAHIETSETSPLAALAKPQGVHARNPVAIGATRVDIVIQGPDQPSPARRGAPSPRPQDGKLVRIGLLWSGSAPGAGSAVPEELRQAFRELGYVDNQNIAFEARYSEGSYERLPALAASLVDAKVDVILAAGDSAAVREARNATRKTPIVMMALADTVRLGFVASLARPGANLTGLSFPLAALAGKQLEMLKKAIPSTRRVGVLWNPSNPGHAPVLETLTTAARTLGVELHFLEARSPDDFKGAVFSLKQWKGDGLLVLWDPMLYAHAGRLTLLALKSRIPTISTYKEFAEAAGLMSYGPRPADTFRDAASYVDKIARGANPADLPVEQPIRFELVVNLGTAKALGLTLPESVQVRVDRALQ
jgi:putative tryptophan/tyrosine transport system substrate-binding protein